MITRLIRAACLSLWVLGPWPELAAKPVETTTIAVDALAVNEGSSGHWASVPELAAAGAVRFQWGILGGSITSPAPHLDKITYTAGRGEHVLLECLGFDAHNRLVGLSRPLLVEVDELPVARITTRLEVAQFSRHLHAAVAPQEHCSYLWTISSSDGSARITSDSDRHSIKYDVGAAGTVTLTCQVKNHAGAQAQASVTVIVVAPPVASISAPSAVTAGLGGWFAAVPAQAGAQYAWTVNGGQILDGVTAARIQFRAGTGSSLTLGCKVTNAFGQTASGSLAVAVVPAPVAVISSETLITAGTANHVASVPAQAGMSYVWSISNGSLTGQGTAQISYSAGTAGQVALGCTVSNAAGTAATGAASVRAVAPPIAGSLSALVNPVPFGGATMLTAHFSDGQGSVDQGIGPVVNGTPFASGAITAAKTFLLTVVNEAGASASTSLTLSAQTVAVAPVVPAAQTVTVGAKLTFSASVTGADNPALTWSASGGSINPATGEWTSTLPGTFTITATSAGDPSKSASTTVTAVAAPVISSFSAASPSILWGDGTVLSWTVSDATSLTLDPGASVTGMVSTNVSPTADTTYTLTASNAAGTTVTASTTVKVLTGPAITSQPKSLTVTVPDGATFSVVARSAFPLSYQWRKNGTDVVGATSDSISVAATDLHEISATYSVAVSADGTTITSDDAALTVMAPNPTWAGDPIPVPSRPLTVLPAATPGPAFPNGSFRFGYDEAMKNPAWVAYGDFRVMSTFPNSGRDFQPDLRLEAPRVAGSDMGTHGDAFYRPDLTGYDRGHMATMSDVSYRYGTQAGDDATNMSNIIPQNSQLNQRIWNRLEQAIGGKISGGTFSNGLNALPITGGRVWVYTGPVYTGTINYWVPSTATYTTDPSSVAPGVLKIAMPTGCYKLMVAQPASGTPMTLAVLMPNVYGITDTDDNIKTYTTSVARLEELAGLDFFPAPPVNIPDIPTWKATVDVRGWGAPFEQSTGPNVHMIEPSWDTKVLAGTTLTFRGAYSSAGSSVVSGTWDFKDGATSSDLVTSHTFTTLGSYSVTFTATDALGVSNKVTRVITVWDGNNAPTFNPAVIKDLGLTANGSGTVSFTLADDQTAAADLTLVAVSNNQALLPNGNILVTSRNGGAVTLTLTPNSGQVGSALVTLTVTDGNGASTSTSFTLAVSAAPVLHTLTEPFEGINKAAYAAADVSWPSGVWNLNDAVTGNLAGDLKNGTYAIRLRNGKVTMKFDWPYGAESVTLKHGKYGADTATTWTLWYSTDQGGTWTQANAPILAATTLTTVTLPIGVTVPVRFELRKTADTLRINFDDFQITGY